MNYIQYRNPVKRHHYNMYEREYMEKKLKPRYPRNVYAPQYGPFNMVENPENSPLYHPNNYSKKLPYDSPYNSRIVYPPTLKQLAKVNTIVPEKKNNYTILLVVAVIGIVLFYMNKKNGKKK